MKTKRTIINIISCIVSFIVTMGISFILTPYITNGIGAEAYGFVTLANNFVSYASIFTLAINSMVARFVSMSYHQGDFKEANSYFNSVLATNFLLIVLLMVPSVLLIFFLEKVVAISAPLVFSVKILFLFIFLNFFVGLINTIYSVSTFIKNRVDLSNLRTMESSILRCIVMIALFAAFGKNIIVVGIGSLCATIYLLVFNIYYTKKLIPEIKYNIKKFEFKKIKTIFISGIWNTITKMGQVLSDGLDLLVSNWFVSPLAMGQLAISKTFSTCISNFNASMSGVFSPNMTYYYAKNDIENEVAEIKFSMKIGGFFTNILVAGFIALGMSFLKLWIPGQDLKIIYLATIVTIGGTIVGSTINSLFNVFTVTNKLKLNSIVTLAQGFLNVLIVYILLKTNLFAGYEILVISGVSVFTSVIKNITFTPIHAADCLNVKKTTFYKPIILGTLSSCILILIYSIIGYLFKPVTWLSLFTCAFICGIIGIIVNYFVLFNKDERKAFLDKFKKLFKRGEK